MHNYANAVVEREGDKEGVDGSLRSSVGIAQRAPPAARGGAADSRGHVVRLERFH